MSYTLRIRLQYFNQGQLFCNYLFRDCVEVLLADANYGCRILLFILVICKFIMSNNKYNKLVLTKRPARFLPDEDQVRKDFGGVSKKPKLDVRLSQSAVSTNISNTVVKNDHFGSLPRKNKLDVRLSQTCTSNTTVANAPAVAVNDISMDDLWGEDLSEEAVEECLFLASQVCPEVNSSVTATTSRQRDPQCSSLVQNCNVGSLSRSSSDGQFKIPGQVSKSSVCQSNFKPKRPTSAFLQSPNRELTRPFSPTKQTLNSHHLKNAAASSSSRTSSENTTGFSVTNQAISSLPVNNHDTDPLAEEIQRLQLENMALKDKSLSKEGEVSILRQQLKQVQMQLENQLVENTNKMEIQAQKFKEQLNEHKKELEITNTQLQFKIMEATTMRNHCKLLESSSKIKLVEPQRCMASDSGKARVDCFSESILPSDISPPKILPSTSSRSKGHTPTCVKKSQQRSQVTDSSSTKLQSCSVLKSSESTLIAGAREGSVLGLSVNEFLFEKSTPEVSWILYIRKKQSLCRRIKEADDINSTILSLQTNDRTLESCYTAVNRLIAMDSLSSPIAWPYVEKVVQECREIVCRQMHILRLLLEVQSKTERVLLSEEIASSIGTLAVKKDGRLMSAGQWYDDEEGVESRRALGLLSVICDISHLAANLITGTIKLTSKGNVSDKLDTCKAGMEQVSESDSLSKDSESVMEQEAGPSNVETNVPVEPVQGPSTTAMETDSVSQEYANKSCKPVDCKGFKADYTEYARKPFGFLCLLRDLASSISIQRRTRHFIGLLTGMMAMLKTVITRSTLINDGLKLMCQIVQEVVFSCPQVEVILALFELLSALAPYPDIMNSLCHNCESSALVDKRYINLTYFSRGSCVAQVLFRLLPNCETSITLRTDLCSHMVHWLYSIVCIPLQETAWLLALQDDAARTCHCKKRLTQGLVTTLYNSVCDFEHALARGNKLEWELCHILIMGVMLLRSLLQREFGLYFESVEEEYQLLISKLQKVLDKLELNSLHRECLTDLLNIEERNDEEKTEIQDEPCNNYWNECAAQCKSLLSKQAPSRRHQSRKPRKSIAQINKAWNIAV